MTGKELHIWHILKHGFGIEIEWVKRSKDLLSQNKQKPLHLYEHLYPER